MKRFFIALLVLIILAATGGYFLFIEAIKPGDLPAKVTQAEEAVATKGTIAIGSVDMTYIRRIDKMFNVDKDPSPLQAPKSAEPEEEKSLLQKLKKQGVDLVSETDYALASINVTQEKPAYSFVLYGRYQPNTLKQALSKHYLVNESENGYWLLTENTELDKKDPCAVPSQKPVKQQALHIQNDRILWSSAEFMPVLLKRFAQKARAGVSLTKWRQFRKEKAVAGALMSPKEVKKGAVNLPSSLLLGAVSNQPLEELYAGAVVSMLPSPGFTFLIDAHSNETAWPLEFKTKYDAWKNDVVNDLVEMPTLAALIKTLNVQADGTVLRMKTITNKNTLDNLEKIPGEFFQMAFSGVFDSDKEKDADAEQVVKDSEVEKYAQQFDFSSVQPFDGKNELYKSDQVVGPLAIRLKKVGLLATDDSVIELKVGVDGKGFENLSSEMMHRSVDSPLANLSITRIEDKEGNNLLREELCGKTRNLAAESLSISRDKVFENNQWISKSIKVSGDKTVRLKQAVLLAQVAKIKGKVAVRAATRTSVQSLQLPLSGKTIDTGKVRMYFRKNSPSTIRYTLSGDMSHIMAVRAKNAKGQYLAAAGSSASGKNTKMVSKRFKGKVASVEVVIAEQMQSQDYPFEINQSAPRYGEKGKGGKKIEAKVTSKSRFLREYKKAAYKGECKDKQTISVGAFMVCLNKFGDRWGREIGGEFDVIAPYEEALQNDISAVVLSIDTVTTENGKEIAFAKNEKASFVYKFDGHYNEKKKNWEILNRRLRGSSVNIFSDKEELKDQKIRTIKGSLIVRFPKRSKYFELGADGLGIAHKSKDGLSAKVAAFEDWNTYIDLQGSVNKVMRFMPIEKGGVVLNTGNDRINEKQYHTFRLSNEDKEKIAALPKKWQGMISIYGEPEVIRVIYANDFEYIKHEFQFLLKE